MTCNENRQSTYQLLRQPPAKRFREAVSTLGISDLMSHSDLEAFRDEGLLQRVHHAQLVQEYSLQSHQ